MFKLYLRTFQILNQPWSWYNWFLFRVLMDMLFGSLTLRYRFFFFFGSICFKTLSLSLALSFSLSLYSHGYHSTILFVFYCYLFLYIIKIVINKWISASIHGPFCCNKRYMSYIWGDLCVHTLAGLLPPHLVLDYI